MSLKMLRGTCTTDSLHQCLRLGSDATEGYDETGTGGRFLLDSIIEILEGENRLHCLDGDSSREDMIILARDSGAKHDHSKDENRYKGRAGACTSDGDYGAQQDETWEQRLTQLERDQSAKLADMFETLQRKYNLELAQVQPGSAHIPTPEALWYAAGTQYDSSGEVTCLHDATGPAGGSAPHEAFPLPALSVPLSPISIPDLEQAAPCSPCMVTGAPPRHRDGPGAKRKAGVGRKPVDVWLDDVIWFLERSGMLELECARVWNEVVLVGADGLAAECLLHVTSAAADTDDTNSNIPPLPALSNADAGDRRAWCKCSSRSPAPSVSGSMRPT